MPELHFGKNIYPFALGALMVQGAVALKNVTEQKKDFALAPLGKIPAKVLFAAGWAVVAYAIAVRSSNPIRGLLAFVGAAAVVGAVFHVKMSKADGKEPNKMIAMLFPLGWVLVAAAIAYKGGPLRLGGVLGAGMVLLSMMQVLPWQRKNGVVDGPGYNLFSYAWVVLAAANSVHAFKA